VADGQAGHQRHETTDCSHKKGYNRESGLEEDEVLTELLGCDSFGGFADVLGEQTDAVPVGLLGAVTDGEECEVLGEGD
jgi:hypothetical protein